MHVLSRLFTLYLFISVFIGHVEANDQTFEEIEWVQLIPKDDLEALLNPPDYVAGIEDGSSLDTLEQLEKAGATNPAAKRFNEALKSAKVIEEYDGKAIRIPGFVVPLETNDNRDVTAFFIVPYFGACLHLPPPPPNQIIYGEWEKGLTVDELSIPMWFNGTINIAMKESELGTSAYKLTVADISPYE